MTANRMTVEKLTRRTFAFQFYRAIGVLGLIPFIIFIVDTLLTPTIPHPLFNNVPVRLAQALVFAPSVVALGYLCVRRAPGNIIGWLLITFGYGLCGDSLRGDFGSPLFRAMFGAIGVVYFWFTNLLILCYFPNGRIYPPRFERIGNWYVAVMCILPLMGIFTQPAFGLFINNELATGRIEAANPFQIPALAFLDINKIGAPVILFTFFYGVGTLILRYRHGNRTRRLQIRWLIAVAVFMFSFGSLPSPIAGLASMFGFGFAFPVTIAYAILRHQLYDIDIIIRRTLVYSILTAILAVIYFGGVILVQQVLKPLTESSDLAIVVSTLAIAALFTPLRRRVQDTIDRRFYRRKYDAEQTLARFNQSLRDEVDMETLQAHLVGVVSETMQPTKVALWVRSREMEKSS